MTFNKQTEGTTLKGAVEGRLDTTTSPVLEGELMPAIEGMTDVTLDFAKLEYISSAGLRILLAAHKKIAAAGGKFVITGVNETVMEVLEITGFSDILTIE